MLHERSHTHHWRGVGQLSLKSFRGGAALYRCGGLVRVDDDSYLVLNAGQEYAVELDAPAPVESLCVFFAPGVVEQAAAALVADESQLADPAQPGRPLEFVVRSHPRDELVGPALGALRNLLTNSDPEPGRIDELLHGLALGLARRRLGIAAEVVAVPARRAATMEGLEVDSPTA